jgi:hypothetical protein
VLAEAILSMEPSAELLVFVDLKHCEVTIKRLGLTRLGDDTAVAARRTALGVLGLGGTPGNAEARRKTAARLPNRLGVAYSQPWPRGCDGGSRTDRRVYRRTLRGHNRGHHKTRRQLAGFCAAGAGCLTWRRSPGGRRGSRSTGAVRCSSNVEVDLAQLIIPLDTTTPEAA